MSSTLYERKRTTVGSAAFRALIVLLYVFLLAPIVIVVILSFNEQALLSFPPTGFSFKWYVALTENKEFVSGFQTSLIVASAAALLSALVGVPAAFAITRGKFKGAEALSTFFLAPLLVPSIVIGLGLLLVFQPLGLVGSYQGLILANAGLTIPYIIRTSATSLTTMDRRCEEAAQTLGATNFAVFRTVTLPLIMPGVISGVAVSFLLTFDEAVVNLFLVSSSVTTLPVRMFNYIQYRADPSIAALSTFLIVVSVVFVIVLERLMGLRKILR